MDLKNLQIEGISKSKYNLKTEIGFFFTKNPEALVPLLNCGVSVWWTHNAAIWLVSIFFVQNKLCQHYQLSKNTIQDSSIGPFQKLDNKSPQ